MKNYKKNIVTTITISRMIGIPFLLMIENDIVLLVAAGILFLTDFLDGFLARRWNVESLNGALLDLIADKALVIILLLYGMIELRVGLLLFSLIAFREIYSMVIRFRSLKKDNEMIEASFIGKLKTTLQFVAILMLIMNVNGYTLLLWITVVLSYYSFSSYFRKYKGVG